MLAGLLVGALGCQAQTHEEVAVNVTDIVVAAPEELGRLGSSLSAAQADIPVRAYEPPGSGDEAPWATLVWAHGGSFVRGTLDWPEADWAARRFAEAGLRVYSVDYRLANDTIKAPIPAADVAAVLAWAAEQAEGPIAVGGASAGGHLAVLAALAQGDAATEGLGRAVDALILQYPTLHRVQREDAAIERATMCLPSQRRFDAARIAEMYDYYLGDDPEALVAGELLAERLATLPPTIIVNAELDDLRASGEQFAEQLSEAGVPVVDYVQLGTVHGYLNRPEESERSRSDAQQTIDVFVTELRRILVDSA